MKKTFAFVVLFTIVATAGHSQSKSYRILREKFQGTPNVFAFSTSGFLARTVLWMAGENEFLDAIEDVRKVRVSVIPQSAFKANDVSVAGFKKLAKKDGFEELAHVKEGGDDLTLLIQSPESKKENRYLLIADGDEETVIMEITGYVDPEILLKDKEKIALH